MRGIAWSSGPAYFFFSSRRRHTRSLCDWSSDVCSSDLINFRPDRMREITRALAEPEFSEFDRDGGERRGGSILYTTMTEYEEGWPYPVAFWPQRPETTIGAVI